MTPEEPTRVFISYSHDSQAHADDVLALANRLRADGVDCSVDQYEESPPEGQVALSQMAFDAKRRGAVVVVSNSDTPVTREL